LFAAFAEIWHLQCTSMLTKLTLLVVLALFMAQSSRSNDILRSIQTTYSKEVWSRFIESIKKYELLQPNDRVCVCISGGKDSALLALLMKQLLKISDFPFTLRFLVMDPGYKLENRKKLEENLKLLGIEDVVIKENILFSVAQSLDVNHPCYMCSKMRRGNLYAYAKEIGCNKIALGHHFDDVIETNLMSMIFGSQIRTMLPKVRSENFNDMELIRPLYLVRESDIKRWRDYNNLSFLRCACPISEEGNTEEESTRYYVKNLISDLHKHNKQADINIFRSMENVQIGSVIEYKDKDGKKHNFLEDY